MRPASTEPTCPVRHRDGACSQPTRDGAVCPDCWRDAEARIRTIPGLLGDLRVTISRQDRVTSSSGGSGGRHAPLPLNPDAVWRRDQLATAVRTWAPRVAAAATPPWPGVPFVLPDPLVAPTDPGAAAWWIATHLAPLRGLPWAPELVDDIDRAMRAAERVIDRPDGGIRVLCPDCGERVSMPPDQHDGQVDAAGQPIRCPGCSIITCRGCGAFGVRSWWIDHAAPAVEPCTLAQLPFALYAAGWTVTHDTVRAWARPERGLITVHSRDKRGRALYDPVAVAAVAARLHARKRKVRPTA